MDLVLEARTGRECVTMLCHGMLVGGKEAEAFRSSAMLLIGGFDNLVIDLAGVRRVDCGGLGSVVAVLSMAMSKGKQVRLAHASPAIMQMLEATKLDEFVDGKKVRPVVAGRDAA